MFVPEAQVPRMLIVVDSVALLRVYRAGVERAGYVVGGEGRTAEDALEQFPQVKPALVIVDNGLRDMDGLDGAVALLKKHPTARILLVGTGAYEQTRKEILRSGVLDLMKKPFSPARFEAKLRHLMCLDLPNKD